MELITNSRLGMWESCPTKVHYHYDLRLRPKGIRWPLAIGRAVHTGMEVLNASRNVTKAVQAALEDFGFIEPYLQTDLEEPEKYEIEQQRIVVYVTVAAAKFEQYPIEDVEVEFQTPLLNPHTGAKSRTFALAGKADGIVVVDGERWLLEYKTSGESKDQFARNYSGNRQISLYTEALGVRGAILRYIGKTKKEPKRRGGEIVESLPDYGARLLDEYLHSEDKFAEFFIVPTDAQRAEFREQVWNAAQVMLFERRGGIVRKNYCECADCEFHAVCHNETGWESQFYQSDIAHDELPGLLRQNTAAHA